MCELQEDILQEYLDGELGKLESLVLEEHLRTCPDCRRELNRLKILDWDLRKLYKQDLPQPGELSGVLERALRQCCAAEESQEGISFRDVVALQVSTFNNAFQFLRMIPGLREKERPRSKPKSKNTAIKRIIGL